MARFRTVAAVVLVILLAVGVPITVGVRGSIAAAAEVYPPAPQPDELPDSKIDHDPAKPTVAIVVGPTGGNVADALAPYEVLAGTGVFNVYTVAPERRAIPLTGGLDLLPDLDFEGLQRLLDGPPDVIIVPAVPRAGDPETKVLEDWLRSQRAEGLPLLASVCVGAEVLASAGLLDDRPATAHWLGLIGLRRSYPGVPWREGVRYVDDGDTITGGGVLSGIDVALRIIERTAGPTAAQQAADQVAWPGYSTGSPADFAPTRLAWADIVAFLSGGYRWDRPELGVLITDGVGEIELAAAFRPYTELSYLANTVALSPDGWPIRSRHGLTFLPRGSVSLPVDRMIVAGADAARDRVADPLTIEVPVTYLHEEPGFAFDGALRDIARNYDVATARWVAKSMQYPDTGVRLEGAAWPSGLTVRPILIALAVVAIALIARRTLIARHAP